MAGARNAGPAQAGAVRIVPGRAGGQQPIWDASWAAQPCSQSGCSCWLQVAVRGV